MASNETRRAAAEHAGEPTFRYERVEDWPGCTDCGKVIMRNIDSPSPRFDQRMIGSYRACGCPGRIWRCPPIGGEWERVPGT